MTTAQVSASEPSASPGRPAWRRYAIWALVVVAAGALANLLGWDIRGWLTELWHSMTSISLGYLVAAVGLLTVQTVATAYGWYAILRFAYPGATRWRDVLAAYAVAVALNSVLPANLGTLVMLVMFTALTGARFAGALGGYAVQKIFFSLAGAAIYLYLFVTVAGSFDRKFGFVRDRPLAVVLLLASAVLLLVLVGRRYWGRVVVWWGEAKEGGAILTRPVVYLTRVFVPSLIGWLAMLASVGVLLAAYGIPVSFETLMHVAGGNQLANMTSVTPGGVGVTQAFNVSALRGVASRADATAYSISSQLINTAWNLTLALVLVLWAWGWSGGKHIVRESYVDARRRQSDQREQRRRRKQASHAGEAAG